MRTIDPEAALLGILASVALASAIALRVAGLDDLAAKRRSTQLEDSFLRSPGHEVLLVSTFEHPLAVGELAWLSIVQVLGRRGAEVRPGHWDQVERKGWIVVDLDPRYFTVYYSVAVQLSTFASRPESSDLFLLRGREHVPTRWELPFLLGYNAYFWHAKFDVGSTYILEASRLPKAPPYLSALAARWKFQGGDREGAMTMLEELIAQMPPKSAERRNAELRMKAFRSEFRLQRFDAACELMRKTLGRFPMDGQDLVDSGFIAEPAVDDYGTAIQFPRINECLSKTATMHTREAEAVEQAGSNARKLGLTSRPRGAGE
ncbi:MAG: hypothetical protein HYV07_15790 [Deltaproteobacteria bacterium]|nr:hypothetical protein [Deltaproteobacteria bacterium]